MEKKTKYLMEYDALDGLPTKPRFQKGDRVYVTGYDFGTIRFVRAKVLMEVPKTVTEHRKARRGKLHKAAPIVEYAYSIGFDGALMRSDMIPENEIVHVNPLLRLADEL